MKKKLEELTDEEVVALVQSYTEQEAHTAFAELVVRYEKKITRYANKFLYTYEDRQDAVQDVFVKVYQNIQSFRTSEKFSPWIYRIAHNTFINVIRKQKREKVAVFDADQFFAWSVADDAVTNRYEQKLDRDALEFSLEKLDVKYRAPLVLYYFEEKDYKEIADILQIPVATVGVRLRRGREKIKKVYNIFNT